ncbi:MAG: hypothetical protein AAB556_02130 [Patescibacteria group bacterium]
MISAEFFDIFGFWGFLFIFSVCLWSLKTKRNIPMLATILFLIISIIGIVVDGTIVYLNFIK